MPQGAQTSCTEVKKPNVWLFKCSSTYIKVVQMCLLLTLFLPYGDG
jgi:hypothetical protein